LVIAIFCDEPTMSVAVALSHDAAVVEDRCSRTLTSSLASAVVRGFV
jgi:hypothetical protein